MASAEWIEEAVTICTGPNNTNCSISPLPQFGSGAFVELTLGTGQSPKISQVNGITLDDSDGNGGTSHPCGLPVGGNRFTVVYGGQCAPINNVTDLQNINQNLSGNYYLAQDIDASVTANWNGGQGLLSIGTSSTPFAGTLDGQNHTISNLSISNLVDAYVGLFAFIGPTGAVRNLHLTNPTIIAGNTASRELTAGSVAGANYGVISDVLTDVSLKVLQYSWLGGLVGFNPGGAVIRSGARGSVSAPDDPATQLGGLIGYNEGKVDQSFWIASVNSQSQTIPGLTSYNEGVNTGTISNSYALGPITVPGLVRTYNQFGSVINSYATGQGGVVGINYQGGTVTNSYWVTDSGQVAGDGSVAVTTSQIKAALPQGFDTVVWSLDSRTNCGYPFLRWQTLSFAMLTLTSSLNPSNFGHSVTFTATVGANPCTPTGTVTFYDGTTAIGTGTLTNGVATFPTTALASGTHTITAVYGGDSNFGTLTSAALTQTVNQVTFALSVTESGNGTVTSTPSGINCGSTCTAHFNSSTPVALTALPANGWAFSGWGGACSGSGPCNVTMNSALSVSAIFSNTYYTLSVSVSGDGVVSSSPSGIYCGSLGSACTMNYSSGTLVVLTGNYNGAFYGWGGACSGTISCLLTMSSAESVTAFFSTSGGSPSSRTWVSASLGNDSNPCTRSSPCLTFAAALAQTTAGGEIDVLDPGDFGAVTITKAITFDGGGGEAGIMTSPGTSGIVISAGATDVVNLRGLTLDGLNASLSGVQINSAAKVNIEKCVIQEFSGSGQLAGIFVIPTSGAVNVHIDDTNIVNNNAGVIVKPTSGATTNVIIERSHIDNNMGGGVRVDGTSGGTSHVAIAESTISFNASNGVVAVSGGGTVNVDLARVTISNNGLAGIQANQGAGGAAVATVGGSVLSANGSAWSILGGATLLSFKNNQITGPTGTAPSQAFFQ
jgi:hypothetical protein